VRSVEAARARRPAQCCVQRQGALQVVLHCLDRVERGEGVLEDHLYVAAVSQHRLTILVREGVLSLQQYLSRRGGIEPGQQTGDGALAAAALAHEGQDAPLLQREADVIDGVDVAGLSSQAEGAAAADGEPLG